MDPYDKLMLTKVSKIEVTTDLMARTIQTNGSNTVNFPLTYSFLHKSPELKEFPLCSIEAFDVVDQKLKPDTDFFNIVVSILFSCIY